MKVNLKRPVYVIGFAGVTAAAFTCVVMVLQAATRPTIERNEKLKVARALIRVFALGDVTKMTPEEIMQLAADRINRQLTVVDPKTQASIPVMRAYDTQEHAAAGGKTGLLAVGFRIGGRGFWAPILGLIALKPDASEITGLVWIENRETPGLGGRITESWFQDQFKGVQVSGVPAGEPIIRYGDKVQAITGATQTSLAVKRFMNDDLDAFRLAWAAHGKGVVSP